MHVLDMIEQRKQMLQTEVISTKQPSHKSNDNFIGQIPSDNPIGDPYMGIDTPSDEFYIINTNQTGPPISARHKLQPRLLRTNPNTKPNTFPKKPARQKWTGPIYLSGHIYKLLSQEAKDALQKYNVEAIQKFKVSRNLDETELMHNVYEHAQEELQPSLVDRGANGGLAGSDVRVLSTSSRKCTVTGIDNHEIPGLDLVQCAAMVQTNHGMVK